MELKHFAIAVVGLFALSSTIMVAGVQMSQIAETPLIVPETIPYIDEAEDLQVAPVVPLAPVSPDLAQSSRPDQSPPANDDRAMWTLTLLYQPIIASLTEIRVEGHRIMLQGIAPLESAEQCGDAERRWPCGRFAVTAFRHYVRNRAIRCAVPKTPSSEPIVTQCFIGKDDIAAWLVSNGWAAAVDDATYGGIAQAAIKSGRGRYAPPPQ